MLLPQPPASQELASPSPHHMLPHHILELAAEAFGDVPEQPSPAASDQHNPCHSGPLVSLPLALSLALSPEVRQAIPRPQVPRPQVS